MLQTQIGQTVLSFGLIVIDMQNGFVNRGGSYDKLGMNIENYRQVEKRVFLYSTLKLYVNLAESIYYSMIIEFFQGQEKKD